MRKYNYKEWLSEGKKLFGTNFINWGFVCPACNKVSYVRDFIELGISKDDALEVAPVHCIGRHNGKGVKGINGANKGNGCDWSANGLLRNLESGVIVKNDLDEFFIFDFYRKEID